MLTMHNAAGLAEPKLANLATIDYPGEISINFVLDGCTDGTELHIQRAFEMGYRFPVYIWPQAERLGKESAIRGALPHLPGKVLMFSDADAVLAGDAVRLLVQALLEKDVGVACGKEIHLTQSNSGAGSGHGLYYRYEHAVKQMQALPNVTVPGPEVFVHADVTGPETPSSLICPLSDSDEPNCTVRSAPAATVGG